jgi:hypothetical protein
MGGWPCGKSSLRAISTESSRLWVVVVQLRLSRPVPFASLLETVEMTSLADASRTVNEFKPVIGVARR